MKLFKNRFFALLLAVVVVIASTLINTDVKFGRECSKVTEQFYADTSRSAAPASISRELVNILYHGEKNFSIHVCSFDQVEGNVHNQKMKK